MQLPFLRFEGDEMRYWGVILLATVGTAILLGLGVWQVQRLAWKTDILAQIERKILAPPLISPPRSRQQVMTFCPCVAQGAISARRRFVS